ncbi:hydantoinase/oxoprolinase family protein [Mangrovicoccus sp. HB161399]|uniref:hydantoinase/oxoprolinase family protein n=1 Tax=Mangrovicoccus sp. HB161399 TaxID=2720392 RepID=UPI001557154D|nr:hydantoinase/oxoprolinase family protein [Mangrovicoccus sp. HB161399]
MTETAKARLAIDIGGTFTDFILEDAGGELHSFKTLTTHEDYTKAIATGIDRLLAASGIAVDGIGQVLHATTLGSNTLLERTGAKTGLITTKGFRDVLEIRDLRMPRLYDQDWDKPETLVRRRWRRVAGGRMLADGTEMTPLDEADIREAVAFLKAGGITSVAVCLINSYANPAHEIRAGEIIREMWPEVHLSLSCELLPEEGEYPRTSTCVINAYVQPVFKDYIARLKGLIAAKGIAAPLFFMQSNGGLTPAETAAEQPIHIIESGPAAGVVGASILGAATGTGTMITLDIGGTTAKAALVQDGQPGMATEFQVGGHVLQTERLLSGGGFSLRVPAIDLAEVGAGGGSIVARDAAGVPQVGPRSAGSNPGPVCYGNGGSELTVTDCNLVLGYLNENSIAGGEMVLDRAAAVAACEAQLAAPLGKAPEEAAQGVFALGCMTMIQAIRAVTTERGQDPRDFAVFAFGGNGPLFAAGIAETLGCAKVIVPPAPGVFSALGLLCAEIEIHKSRSFRRLLDGAAVADAQAALAEMATLAEAEAQRPGGRLTATARMRYAGQSSDLLVPLGDPAALTEAAMRAAFTAEHDAVFKFTAPEGEPVRITAIELCYALPVGRLDPNRRRLAREGAASTQRAFFGAAGWLDAPVIPRTALTEATGPCIVTDPDATTLVPPGAVARVTGTGSLEIVLAAKVAAAAEDRQAENA